MAELYQKVIEVGCAIIEKDGKILIAQRNPGAHLGGYWEFPGGKRKPDETFEDCLIREVKEELGIEIRPREFLCQAHYAYPEKEVFLYFYVCDWIAGKPVKHDCFSFQWAALEDLRHYRFPPADQDMINELIRGKAYYF